MKKINPDSTGQNRRPPEFSKNVARKNHNLKLWSLAYETQRYWDELNAKLFLDRYELTKLLSSLEPETEKYNETKEQLKKVELLYKDVLLQLDFTSSFSGRGDNPFVLEDEWINRPWDQKPWDKV